MNSTKKPKVIAVVGPTAAGKTSLSITLAKNFSGEVISADSRQVYRGLDLGSGKVTKEEMAGVPHHLLDVVDPMDIYTGADFKKDAEQALKEILERNHLPIVAGGSFFYLELLRGSMQTAPVKPDQAFRKTLERYSTLELFTQLQTKDPKRADSIDPNNRRRLERSLEIINALGHVPKTTKIQSPYNWLLLGVDITKEHLHQNIHLRLHQRLEEGMVAEVENLLAAGVTQKRLDDMGLEYRYLVRYIQKDISYKEMCEHIETKSRQFAKRQLTWLKRYPEIVWVDPKETTTVINTTQKFLNQE